MEEKYDLSSQQQMAAEKHPKAWDPLVLLLCIPLGLGGAIIGYGADRTHRRYR